MSKIRQILLSVLVVCGVSMFVSASASALEFYKCVKVAPGAGRFESSNCVKEGGSKEFELELLKELLKVVSKGTLPFFAIGGKIGGVVVEISCAKVKGTGSIHNGQVEKDLEPGKGDKILTGLGLLALELECTVPKPPGQECKVRVPIVILSLIQLSTVNGKTYVLFSPDPSASSTALTNLTIEGCKTAVLNGTFPLEGMLAGLVNNATSRLEFLNEEPNKRGILGGGTASVVGELLVEMEGGGFINAH